MSGTGHIRAKPAPSAQFIMPLCTLHYYCLLHEKVSAVRNWTCLECSQFGRGLSLYRFASVTQHKNVNNDWKRRLKHFPWHESDDKSQLSLKQLKESAYCTRQSRSGMLCHLIPAGLSVSPWRHRRPNVLLFTKQPVSGFSFVSTSCLQCMQWMYTVCVLHTLHPHRPQQGLRRLWGNMHLIEGTRLLLPTQTRTERSSILPPPVRLRRRLIMFPSI